MYSEANIGILVKAADLDRFEEHLDTSIESIKCLVNFAIRAMEIEKANGKEAMHSLVLKVLREENWGQKSFNCLKGSMKQSMEGDTIFALCRLLNMELWDIDIRNSLLNQETVDTLIALLTHHVEHLEKSGEEPANSHRFNIAGDVMRMFFQLTTEYGPLNRQVASAGTAYPMTSEASKLESDAHSEPFPPYIDSLFVQSIELLKRVLLFDFNDAKKSQLQMTCIPYALNMSKEQILKFDAYVTLPHLIKICNHQLVSQDFSAAASMLMLFTKIARDEPKTRALFMETMFPKWREIFQSEGDAVKMPPQHNDTMGKLIIDAMQSSNTGLQFYANEFVFLLCNENAGAFTRFVGFGPAAGHLAVRGLMNFGGDVAQRTGPGAAGQEGNPPPKVTNWKERKIPEPDMSNMSPEDLKEWNELLAKIDRLDELGVIKMVGSNDNKNNNNEDQSKEKKKEGEN